MAADPFYTDLPALDAYREYIDGVFKGGGTGGVAYGGALEALARNGVWFKRVAGTSAGAITAAIIAAGYNANEIDYLGAPEGTRSGPPPGLPRGVKTLNYYSIFIDPALSPNDLQPKTKHGNLVYEAIVGKVIDEVIKHVIPLPKIEDFLDKILDEVIKGVPKETDRYKATVGPFEAKAGPFKKKVLGRTISVGPFKIKTPEYEVIVGPFPLNVAGIKPIIRKTLIKGLTVYPKSILLGGTGFLATDDLRRMFADAAVDAVLLVNPWLTMFLNCFMEGGLVRGNNFLEAIRNIVDSKTGKTQTKFKHLKMDFACVAADITAHEMRVYSNQTTPDMEVAEAVRRSMAIPLFFEPRRDGGNEIVDGGTIDNYPLGFYLARNNGYWSNSDEDMARVKFGFSPGKLGSGPGDSIKKLFPVLPALPTVESMFLTRLLNIAMTNLVDSPLFTGILNELKTKYKLHEVKIDGNFGATDFDITKEKFKKMCSKGWVATAVQIQEAVAAGHLPNVQTPLKTADPY